jgi:hypothetical protein
VLLLLVGQLAFVGNLVLLLCVFFRPICQAICAECCPGLGTAKAGGNL